MKTEATVETRQALIWRTLNARTLLEIDAAWQALQAWMQAYPEDEGMREGFEQLAQMREALTIAGEELPTTQSAFRNEPERGRLLERVLEANTLDEVRETEQLLRDWLCRYPEDAEIQDILNSLSQLHDSLKELPATV